MCGDWEVMSYGKQFCLATCALLAAYFMPAAVADGDRVMAVVSFASKKADAVYEEVADGIKAGFSGAVKVYKVKEGFSEQKLLADLKSDGVDIVTTLGNKSQKVASQLSLHYPVQVGVAAAVLPKNVGGVTYMPSSSLVIDRLRMLAPDVDNLYLVYNPAIHSETLAQIKETAAKYRIQVTARASTDPKQTQAAIESTLQQARNGTDSPRNALWVLFRTQISKPNIESLIKGSWDRPVIPFYYSPNPKLVDSFPFVFLPDWKGMGEQLADMGERRLDGEQAEVLPLENIKLWVNQKKCRHYGLKLDGESRKKIDNIYNR